MFSSKIIAFLLLMIIEVNADETIVNLKYGKVRGIVKKNIIDGSEYTALLGIPYTKVILEEKKFADSEKVEPWGDKILNATKYGSGCLSYYLKGNLDCLFINIFIPKNAKEEILSSMLWIHGGSFVFGSGDDEYYGPDFLLTQNIILATINYRLGPFGFLSAGTPLCPGNMGLKDQNIAIRFLKENLPEIGGDPDQITIFGESAGAASVGFHVLSPLSAGLFGAAIQESGTVLDVWAFNPDDAQSKIKLLKQIFNLTSTSPANICEELTNKWTAEDINNHLYQSNIQPRNNLAFIPTLEYCKGNCKTFLPEPPQEMLIKGNFNRVPIIIGMNADETAASAGGMKKLFDSQPSDDPHLILYILPKEIVNTLEDLNSFPGKLFEFYTGKPKLGGTTEQITMMTTDILFTFGWLGSVNFYTQYNIPVYGYYFQHRTITEFKKLQGLTEPSCAHTDDIFYLFYAHLMNNTYKDGTDDYNISKFFLKTWTNFAKSKDPTSDDFDLLQWLTYEDTKSLMTIDKDPEVLNIEDIENGYLSRICWWLSVFKKEYRDLIKVFDCTK